MGAEPPSLRVLDVRWLDAPEPLERALAALDGLETGECLCLRIHREPFPLYGMLESSGFDYSVRAAPGAEFEIMIWHRGDHQAQVAAGILPPP